MREYFKCVFRTLLVTCFIATLFTTITYLSATFYADTFDKIYHYSLIEGKKMDALVEVGQKMEGPFAKVETMIKEEKEMFGDDYPALGVYINRVLCLSTGEVAYTNLIAILVGVILGTIIYIIAVQKAKGKKLVVELLVSLLIIMALIQICMFIYGMSLNKCVGDVINDRISIENHNNIIIPYLVLFGITVVLVAVGNRIYQSVMTKKLNQELGNQEKEEQK